MFVPLDSWVLAGEWFIKTLDTFDFVPTENSVCSFKSCFLVQVTNVTCLFDRPPAAHPFGDPLADPCRSTPDNQRSPSAQYEISRAASKSCFALSQLSGANSIRKTHPHPNQRDERDRNRTWVFAFAPVSGQRRDILGMSLQLAMKPRFGRVQLSCNCLRGHAHNLGNFIDRETSKIAKLNNSRQTRIELL